MQLAATSKKLKESREEGEQIRADLKRMITQYQVLLLCIVSGCVSQALPFNRQTHGFISFTLYTAKTEGLL